ncbi:MAG: glycosyltransferase family 4 protein [bacterium]
MKILYITQYYPPEIGAGAFRAGAIVKGLAKLNHKLTVITEIPNYPLGKVYNNYKGFLWQCERIDNISIHRVWVKISQRMNFLKRMVLYGSYVVNAILRGINLKSKFDVLYMTSPPLFVGIVGYFLSKYYRIPIIFEVRDLWPEIAIEMGQIKGRIAKKMSQWLEIFLYRKSSIIIAVTNGFKKKIIEKGINRSKIRVVLNFSKCKKGSIDNIRPNNKIRNIYKSKFVVIYAGLFGMFQGVDVILRAADQLRNQSNIVFLLIGSGVEETNLKEMAKKKGLTNVYWLLPQPDTVVHGLIADAGCSVIPLKDLPGLKMTIPSKLFDYMGYGSPIILSASGEVNEILERAKAGIAVKPENATLLAEAIMRLYKNEKLRIKLRNNGKKAVLKYYSSNRAITSIHYLIRSIGN